MNYKCALCKKEIANKKGIATCKSHTVSPIIIKGITYHFICDKCWLETDIKK